MCAAARMLDLPGALAEHARSTPEDPWLFFAEGWNWRWCSFRDLDSWAACWAVALGELPAGTRLRFPYRPSPQGVALDLAAQAAGLIAQAGPGSDTWRVIPEGGPAEGIVLPPWRETPALETGPSIGGPADARARSPAMGAGAPISDQAAGAPISYKGSVVVEDEQGPRTVSQAELMSWVARIESEVRPSPGAREVVVSCRPLAEPAERAWLAWATVAGAAVVLEQDPASLVATAAWARPTLFAGTAAELEELRRLVARRRGDRRLPLGRLRLLWLRGRDPVDKAALEFWRQRGVRVAGCVV
jgi:hypothetical protein